MATLPDLHPVRTATTLPSTLLRFTSVSVHRTSTGPPSASLATHWAEPWQRTSHLTFHNLCAGLYSWHPEDLSAEVTRPGRAAYYTQHLALCQKSWIERLVAKRLYTGPEMARSIEPEPDTSIKPEPDTIESAKTKTAKRGDAVYASSHYALLPRNPYSTVGAVVDWQIKHHKGFVPAFISSIRHAPVHDEHARWNVLGQSIKNKSGKLTKVHIVLGETDPIIVKDEIIKDATECLGSGNVEFEVVGGAGHEVAIERADDIVRVVGRALHLW